MQTTESSGGTCLGAHSDNLIKGSGNWICRDLFSSVSQLREGVFTAFPQFIIVSDSLNGLSRSSLSVETTRRIAKAVHNYYIRQHVLTLLRRRSLFLALPFCSVFSSLLSWLVGGT